MALKTEEKKDTDVKKVASEPDTTIILELSLYKIYNYHGKVYKQGVGYRFKREDAIILMGERDAGRPLWKQYRPKKVVVPKSNIVDATEIKIEEPSEPIHGLEPEKGKAIFVGDESEIADIINNADNVTV